VSFFEATGALVKICSSLKPNHRNIRNFSLSKSGMRVQSEYLTQDITKIIFPSRKNKDWAQNSIHFHLVLDEARLELSTLRLRVLSKTWPDFCPLKYSFSALVYFSGPWENITTLWQYFKCYYFKLQMIPTFDFLKF